MMLAEARRIFTSQLAFALPAVLAVLLLALALLRRQRALAEANALLERRVRERTAVLQRRSAEAAELASALDLSATMVRGRDGTVLHWSRGCERLYGVPARSAIGHRAHSLLGTIVSAPGSLAAAEAELAACGEWRGELRQRHRDGRTVIVLAHWMLRRIGEDDRGVVVEAVADVTALRRAEAEREEARALLATTLDAAGMGIWQFDPARGTVEASEGMDRLFGLASTGGRRPLADYLAGVHPEDAERLRHELDLAAAIGHDISSEFRLLRPEGALRWIVLRGGWRTLGDRTRRYMGALADVTALKEAEAALQASEARLRLAQEAGGIGTWEWDPATDRLSLSEEAQALFGLAGAARPLRFADWLDRLDPAERPAMEQGWREAAAARAPLAIEFRLGPLPAEPEGPRWLAARGRSLAAEKAEGQRLFGVVIDVTERKRAEQRQALLMREVDHRAKNALAVVQAALRLTPKHDPASYARAVEGRVKALARAHTLLAAGRWSGTGLQTLLEGELAPFLHPGGEREAPRAELAGPPVVLPPRIAQALSMALHELATNATKYGALSVSGGRVAVRWAAEAGMLRLSWTESGGPPVAAPPAARGFGSRVIEGTIADQLGGRVLREWPVEGLVCRIAVPLGAPTRREALAEVG
jgi:PAS domain S-box-containing protein